MTANREYPVWYREQTFGVYDGTANPQRIGGGLTFSYTRGNNYSKQYGVGAKAWDVATTGKYAGTFSGTYIMNYNDIAFLTNVFEGYTYTAATSLHRFYKVNGKRVPSFTVKSKKLNRVVGGANDQTDTLTGCVITSWSWSQSGSNGALSANFNGTYAGISSAYEDLESTGYQQASADSVEFAQLAYEEAGAMVNIGYVESAGMTVTNGVQTITPTSGRFATGYYEGQEGVTMKAEVYSSDIEPMTRLYSGGNGYGTTVTGPAKHLIPLTKAVYTATNSDGSYKFECIMTDVTYESMGASYNSSTKITDSPTLGARDVSLEFTNDTGTLAALY